jgi:hypothetical protein
MEGAAFTALKQALKGRKSITKKGFVCNLTGEQIGRRTQLARVGKKSTKKFGTFGSLIAAFEFVEENVTPEHAAIIREHSLGAYNQKHVPRLIDCDAQTLQYWTGIPGTESFEDYVAARAAKKAAAGGEKPKPKAKTTKPKASNPDAALKKVKSPAGKKASAKKNPAKDAAAKKVSPLIIAAGTSVLVRPTANVAKALQLLGDFRSQAAARARIHKAGGYEASLDKSSFIERSVAHSEDSKAKPNVWFPGAYGPVLVTTARAMKLKPVQ